MVFDLDDPIAKREKREAEAILSGPVENLKVSSDTNNESKSEKDLNDLMSVLDTVEKKSKKKYKK